LPVNNGPARYRPSADPHRFTNQAARNGPKGSHHPKNIPINAKDLAYVCVAEPRGILCDSLQYRLEVCRRSADHAQYAAGRRLLLQRFAEFPALRLKPLPQFPVGFVRR